MTLQDGTKPAPRQDQGGSGEAVDSSSEVQSSLLRFIQENPQPILRIDCLGKVAYANRAGLELLKVWGVGLGEKAPDVLWETCRPLSGQGLCRDFEIIVKDKLLRLEALSLPFSDDVFVCSHVGALRNSLEPLEQLARRVLENSSEGIAVADENGMVQMVNPAYSKITGFAWNDVIGRPLSILSVNEQPPDFQAELQKTIKHEGRWSGEYWNRDKDGRSYQEWLTLSVIKDAGGKVVNYVAVLHDIDEMKQQQARLVRQAQYDALTGLPNRALFNDRVKHALSWASRRSEELALFFIDLDDFKNVNDTLGHPVGDELLKDVAERLQNSVREGDTVARLGGDEFTVICPSIGGAKEAAWVAQRILDAMSAPHNLRGYAFQIGASIGITMFPADGKDQVTLLKNADMAMYRAKGQGKNQYALFRQDMSGQAASRAVLVKRLRMALDHDEFVVYYQPVIEVGSGRIIGAEALLRWRKDGEVLPPTQFLALAEESGLILPIGSWMLRNVCEQAREWSAQGLHDLAIGLNLSPHQFGHKNLMSTIREFLAESGGPPHLLELEVAESTVMDNIKRSENIIRELEQTGVRISLDDFGTGFSSLYHLRSLPISSLKVDRAYVAKIGQDPESTDVARTIIAMGHALSMKVVAEGVETRDQFDFLKEQGCDNMQGFYFSPPLPAQDFKELYLAKQSLD